MIEFGDSSVKCEHYVLTFRTLCSYFSEIYNRVPGLICEVAPSSQNFFEIYNRVPGLICEVVDFCYDFSEIYYGVE